jgi:two-component system CAI-1 autoinducer sensor kinase/phosphatase CqsS
MCKDMLQDLLITSRSPSRIKRLLHALWRFAAPWGRLVTRIKAEVLQEQLVPILHASTWRMRALGMATIIGHPLLFWVWGYWLPQPYENPVLRAIMAALGLWLLSENVTKDVSSKLAAHVFTLVFWLQLPLFFSWMYLNNNGNPVWLASFCAMVFIYYHVTDWRMATLGMVSGVLLAKTLFDWVGPQLPPLNAEQFAINAVVIAFSWTSAFLLSLTSANLRREHRQYTLNTVGIMAHEMRTPLATLSLIGDAIRNETRRPKDELSEQRTEQLVVRLHTLVRNMNQQIDTQMANARPLRLSAQRETVVASELLRHVVKDYPYRSLRERDSVELVLRRDFSFESSYRLFVQVINNLLKNAFHAMAANSAAPGSGALRIEVGVLGRYGRIIITDQGPGIPPELQGRIFEPFFSTDRSIGHGLGLAFCRQVVRSANGTLRVLSVHGQGAVFTIELPLDQ